MSTTREVVDSRTPPIETASMGDGVIERYAAAWQAGDLTGIIDAYAEDVIAHYGGTSPYRGTHMGRDAFLAVLAESSARSQRVLRSIDQIHDDGPTGALFATEAITVDGEVVEVARALRYRIVGGRIAELWLYDLDQHLVDRSWADATG